jgi:spore coat protein CotH
MGAESDWVLNGMYFDRALFRNKLGYDLFQLMSPDDYAPQSVYCRLTLDGGVLGLYALVERVKADDDRVAIDLDGDSGRAFVVKLHDSDFVYPNRLGTGGWRVVSPSQESLSTEARAEVVNFFTGLYGALESADPYNAETGIWTYVDLDSLVNLVLIEELTKNNDAWFLSVHAWKAADGKLHFTPWDLDLSLGQPSYNDNENPASWVAYRPAWVATMVADPAFTVRLAERWAELRGGPFDEAEINARIDGYQATMTEAAIDENFDLWPIGTIQFGGYLYPVASYAEEDSRVREWAGARLEWMDANIDEY